MIGQRASSGSPDAATVTIVYRWLPQYRVPFYEQLRDRLKSENVDLNLIVGQADDELAQRRDGAKISWAETVTNRYIGRPGRQLVWQPCLRALESSDLVIVEQASKLLLNYLLLGWRPFGGPKVAFWGHGINLDRHSASRPGEFLKRRLASSADWWFCYTEGTARIVETMGVPADRRTVVQNAVDTRAIAIQRRSITKDDCMRLRAELGIGSGPIGISIGSIYPNKRPTYLLEAADAIRSLLPNFELVVIGDGPDRSIIDRAAATRSWIHPLGALAGMELVRHAALGSVMLNPGLIGLAVLDAFALDLPVVTCDLPLHSPEIEYLVDGENGAILPSETSPQTFGAFVAQLLGDHQTLGRLQSAATHAASSYTIDEMADRFAGGVFQALGRCS